MITRRIRLDHVNTRLPSWYFYSCEKIKPGDMRDLITSLSSPYLLRTWRSLLGVYTPLENPSPFHHFNYNYLANPSQYHPKRKKEGVGWDGRPALPLPAWLHLPRCADSTHAAPRPRPPRSRLRPLPAETTSYMLLLAYPKLLKTRRKKIKGKGMGEGGGEGGEKGRAGKERNNIDM